MARFKVALWQDGEMVSMQVLEMDEALRGKGLIHGHSNGLRVESSCVPDLYSDFIYLRGSDSRDDNRVGSRYGDSGYFARVRDALIAAGGEVVGRPGEEPAPVETPQPECPPAPTPPDIRTYRLDVLLDDRRPTFSVELKLTSTQYGDLVRYVASLI